MTNVLGRRYSFGTGTQALPIPELVPFRLTRQLVGVFQPHDATAALQAPLAQGLAALRASRHIIEVQPRNPAQIEMR
jgi:DNA-dependent protein kinase catalytic subunit